MATFILQAQQQRQQHQRHSPVLLSFIITMLISLLSTPSVVCRSVPTSPLSDERAEELLHEKINGELVAVPAKLSTLPAAELNTFYGAPATYKVTRSAWKLRSLWVSVTGKQPPSAILGHKEPPSAILQSSKSSSSKAETRSDELYHRGKSITSNETLVYEARQVPGGPDPLHHSNQPSSP